MKTSTSKALKTIIPLALGVFLTWLSLSKFSATEINQIKNAFYNVNYWWISLSVFIGLLSHLSRAYRWKFMLKPLGYETKFYNNAFAVFIAYFVNMGIPRAGEVSRAATISKYENIPFEKAFGTIIAERIADMIVYLFIILLAFITQYDQISKIILDKLPNNPIYSILILAILAIGSYIFITAIKKSTHPIFKKIHAFITGLLEGIKTIFTMDKKWFFIAHTLFIWAAYVLMLYVVGFAFPEIHNLSFGAILICFIVGTFSFATTNGGIGIYPLSIQKTLLIYGVAEVTGASFGWIMWSAQTLLIIVLGLLAFLLLPVFNKSR